MICEKCGFEYKSAKCPVCAEEEITEPKSPAVTAGEKKSSLGLVGMILAIASFTLNFVAPGVPEFPCAIAGLIVSLIAIKKHGADGYSKTGLIMSIVKIALTIITTVCALVTGILGLIMSILTLGFNLVSAFSSLAECMAYILEFFQSAGVF